MIVHVAWCNERKLWLLWAPPMRFWCIIRPTFSKRDPGTRHLRAAVERGWNHTAVEELSTRRLRTLEPLMPNWKLLIHAPSDNIDVFQIPKASA